MVSRRASGIVGEGPSEPYKWASLPVINPIRPLYAAAYHVVNNKAAQYAPFPPIDPLPTPGANVRSFGIGMLHHFSATASTPQ